MTWGDSSVLESACKRQLPQQLIHEDADISSNDKRNCNLSKYKCCARGELMSLPESSANKKLSRNGVLGARTEPKSRLVGSDLRVWHRLWTDYGQTFRNPVR